MSKRCHVYVSRRDSATTVEAATSPNLSSAKAEQRRDRFEKLIFLNSCEPNAGTSIVFVWSQYDGGNIDKDQWLRFPPKPNEA